MATTIKTLLIKIGSDVKELKRDMQTTQSGMKKTTQSVKKAGSGFKSMWAQMALGQAAFAAVKKGFGMIKQAVGDSIEKYKVQEKAERLLQVALNNTANQAGKTVAGFKAFAAGLQKITTVGDETTLQIMQLGLTMGINSGQIEKATKGAIGLSKAYGIDLKTSMKMVALAAQGEYTLLNRYIPQLRVVKSETEKAAIVQKVFADGFKLATAEAESASGKLEQFSNIVGDFKEKIGGAILESEGFNILIDEMKEMFADPVFQQSVVTFINTIMDGLKVMVDLAVKTIKGFADLSEAIGLTNRAAENQMRIMDTQADQQKKVTDRFREFMKSIESTKETRMKINKDFGKFENLALRYNKAMQAIAKGKYGSEMQAQFIKWNAGNIKLRKSSEDLNDTEIENIKTKKKKIEVIKEELDLIPKIIRFKQKYISTEEMMTAAADELFNEMIAGIPVMEEVADVEEEAADEGMNLADTMQVIASAASSLKGLLGNLGIEIGGLVDGFINAASGAATFAKALGTGDIAGMIAGAATAVDGLVTSMKELFGSKGVEQAIQRENSWMRMNDELKESLEKLAKEVGNTHAATSMMLSDIMSQSDVTVHNFDKWASRIKEIFIDFNRGLLSETKFMESIGSSWNQLVENAQRLGTEGSMEMLEIIREMNNQGMKIAEIQEYVDAKMKSGLEGYERYLAGGFSDTTIGVFEELIRYQKKVADNQALVDGVKGFEDALMGLSSVTELSEQQFDKFEDIASDALKSLEAQGFTSEEALKMLAPSLSRLIYLQNEFGLTIDDSTQAMIDQAKEAGISLEKQLTPQEEMRDMMKQLVDIFGKAFPAAIDKTIDKFKGLTNQAGKFADINYGMGELGKVNGYAGGANFTVPGGYERDNFLMGVSSGEHVMVTPKHEVGDGGGGVGIKADKINVSLVLPNVTNSNAVNDIKRELVMNEQGLKTQIIKIVKSRSN